MVRKQSSKAISVAASSTKACKTRKQREVEDEEIAKTIPMSAFFNKAVYGFENLVDDVDEQSEEFQSQLDYQDITSEKEEKILDALFHKDGTLIANRLSDAIASIKEPQDKDEGSTSVAETTSMSKSRAIDYFQSVGKFMSVYTHGKMPKALYHVISKSGNLVGLLKLTQPESWSPSAMYKATSMFASTTKAGLFYELFLLPRVREDIRNHNKLHFCLYQSLKKTLFKPMEFYLGIIIPLCKSGTCTLREAVIIGSIMQKVSIPGNYSSTALACLADLKFCSKTRYKDELRKEDKKSLRSLLDKQNHKLITPKIARELDNSRNRGEKLSNNLPSAPRPIKEDLFDMPDVPMEED